MTSLANNQFGREFRINKNAGQFVEATRKNHFRMPQKVDLSNPTADPASGAGMGVQKVKLPLEFIHEWTGIGTIAGITSMRDLEEWAEEDMPIALMRRRHQLVQNAFKVGRFRPGKYAADGTAAVAFDTTVEATMSAYGLNFTFLAAPARFVNDKENFAALEENDRFTWRDFEAAHVALSNSGAPKIQGCYIAHISDAIKSDLMQSDKYFQAAVHAYKNEGAEGLKYNRIVKHRGWLFVEDDEPFTEDWSTANVRAVHGPIHTAICHGANAYGFLRLGGDSPAKPKMKMQDTTKTGVEKTLGYLVPNQAAIINQAWCRTITGPVTHYEQNAA
jgi:hypothetical protein